MEPMYFLNAKSADLITWNLRHHFIFKGLVSILKDTVLAADADVVAAVCSSIASLSWSDSGKDKIGEAGVCEG